MKIMCAWCQEIMGHKCPHCGTRRAPEYLPPIALGREPMFFCLNCKRFYQDDKTTHGICEICAAQQLNLLGKGAKT